MKPETGGSVSGFGWADGVTILRDVSKTAYEDARGGACFPLVPYSNRVRGGCFALDGREVVLSPNVPGSDTVAHGDGWRAQWTVLEQATNSMVLRYEHAAAEWPWAYQATQHVAIEPDGLSIRLTVTNLSDSAMPAGLGLHPYFPFREGVRVIFCCERCSAVGENNFPTNDPSAAALLAQASRDGISPAVGSRYLSGCAARATIVDPTAGHEIALSFSATASNLTLYLDPDSNFFCVEPMTHAVGALNDDATLFPADKIDRLAPGETMELAMHCAVARRSESAQ